MTGPSPSSAKEHLDTIREALNLLHIGHQNARLPEEPPCPYCERRAAGLAALTEVEHQLAEPSGEAVPGVWVPGGGEVSLEWLRPMIGTDQSVSGDAQRAAEAAHAALDELLAERDRYRAALEVCREAVSDFGHNVMVGDHEQTIEAFVDSVLGEGEKA